MYVRGVYGSCFRIINGMDVLADSIGRRANQLALRDGNIQFSRHTYLKILCRLQELSSSMSGLRPMHSMVHQAESVAKGEAELESIGIWDKQPA